MSEMGGPWGGRKNCFIAFSLPCFLSHPDNLTEVQALVERVKEKSRNIQALVHSTVGQSLPVSVRPWGEDLGMVRPRPSGTNRPVHLFLLRLL